MQLHGRNRLVVCLGCHAEFPRAVVQERLAETVWSGFRFVKRAADRGIPIAIVNIGPTRGDDLASVKIEGRCGEVLPSLLGG